MQRDAWRHEWGNNNSSDSRRSGSKNNNEQSDMVLLWEKAICSWLRLLIMHVQEYVWWTLPYNIYPAETGKAMSLQNSPPHPLNLPVLFWPLHPPGLHPPFHSALGRLLLPYPFGLTMIPNNGCQQVFVKWKFVCVSVFYKSAGNHASTGRYLIQTAVF